MLVKCINAQPIPGDDTIPDLIPGNVYVVLGIEADNYRLIGSEGKPYLYPVERFEMVDPAHDPTWLTTTGQEGERYSYPPEFLSPGFFEAYFEGDALARKTFERIVPHIIQQALAGTGTP